MVAQSTGTCASFTDVYIPTTWQMSAMSSLSCITQRQAPLKDNEMRCVGPHIGTASSTKHTRHTQRELPKHIKYVSKASKAAHETGVNHLVQVLSSLLYRAGPFFYPAREKFLVPR